MMKACRQCHNEFQVFDEDLKFFEKVSPVLSGKKYLISPPTCCPDCRQRRRLSYRNERNFYKRKCDLSGENIVSVYSPEFKGKVFSHESFYGDKWDSADFGRDFDFSRPFFEQFLELSFSSPRLCTVMMNSENSVYTNHSAYNKNCYMCINTGYSEDLLYCTNYNLYNKDCVDCLTIFYCEKCYFCVSATKAYSCTFLYVCVDVTDCYFCFDCQGCDNCFGCWNLRHKSYCIFNKQYSKDEYEEKLQKLKPKSWPEQIRMFEGWKKMMEDQAIHRHLHIEKSINSGGDYLDNCQNVQDSFYTFGSEDCRYCYDAGKLRDCYDCTEPFNEELHYELQASFNGYHNLFSLKNLEAKNTIYCQYCIHSQDCFGCAGMNGGQYRIFNKQYTKEQYEDLAGKIIEHMKKTGEWGEFFPANHSPFAYNETVAQDFYPITGQEAAKNGLKWHDETKHVSGESSGEILKCEVSGRLYRLVPAEIAFYEKMGLPLPARHFEERVKMRLGLRNPRKLYTTVCGKCSAGIETSCPVGTAKIYCEKCYLEAVY